MHVTAMPLLVELPVGDPVQITVSITNTTSMIDAYSVRGVRPRPAVGDRHAVPPVACSRRRSASSTSPWCCRPTSRPACARRRARAERERPDRVLARPDRPRRRHPRQDDAARRSGHRHRWQQGAVRARSSPTRATPRSRPGRTERTPRTSSRSAFEPPTVVLAPNRREIVRADVRGGRPWFGQPKPRVLSFSLGPDSPPAMATFLQRPRIGRWLISLLGLVTVASIFALVLSTVADRLVDEAGVDDELINQALTQPGGEGAEGVSVTPSVGQRQGDRRQHRTGRRRRPGRAVLVRQRRRRDRQRGHQLQRGVRIRPAAGRALPGPRQRRRLRHELWYQASITFADATDIEVVEGQPVVLEDIEIGGRPGQRRRRGHRRRSRPGRSPGSSCPVSPTRNRRRSSARSPCRPTARSCSRTSRRRRTTS